MRFCDGYDWVETERRREKAGWVGGRCGVPAPELIEPKEDLARVGAARRARRAGNSSFEPLVMRDEGARGGACFVGDRAVRQLRGRAPCFLHGARRGAATHTSAEAVADAQRAAAVVEAVDLVAAVLAPLLLDDDERLAPAELRALTAASRCAARRLPQALGVVPHRLRDRVAVHRRVLARVDELAKVVVVVSRVVCALCRAVERCGEASLVGGRVGGGGGGSCAVAGRGRGRVGRCRVARAHLGGEQLSSHWHGRAEREEWARERSRRSC